MDKFENIHEGCLWEKLSEQTQTALAEGALRHIDSRQCLVMDGGIPFVVRIANNLQRKTIATRNTMSNTRDINPFLPPDKPLTVGAIGTKHLAVLNKFNVVEHHLLIVTRHFEPQEALLTLSDFEALCRCLHEIDGLGFYNGGGGAGASQRHKHMQLIPLPLTQGQECLPIERLFPEVLPPHPSCIGNIPFAHRIAALSPHLFATPEQASKLCYHDYKKMLQMLQGSPIQKNDLPGQPAPYNLLLTKNWIMLVPRTHEYFETISINALGFAGSFFLKNRKELERVKAVGPLFILKSVTPH